MTGASSLGSVFRETNDEESIKVVHHAIKSGINYIDVAPWYGHGKAETVLSKVCINFPFSKLLFLYFSQLSLTLRLLKPGPPRQCKPTS